jgi:hypothetical protein
MVIEEYFVGDAFSEIRRLKVRIKPAIKNKRVVSGDHRTRFDLMLQVSMDSSIFGFTSNPVSTSSTTLHNDSVVKISMQMVAQSFH